MNHVALLGWYVALALSIGLCILLYVLAYVSSAREGLRHNGSGPASSDPEAVVLGNTPAHDQRSPVTP